MHAINTASTDGNADTLEDAAWSPLIPTPSFPAYTSGHSAFSMAAATILASFFGTDNIAFTTDSESPFLPLGYTRDFTSFSQAAAGGRHEPHLRRHSLFLGQHRWCQALGEPWLTTSSTLYFLPVPEPGSALLLMLGSDFTAPGVES
jgi:hypothetical protein